MNKMIGKTKKKLKNTALIASREFSEFIPLDNKKFNRIKIALNNRTKNYERSLQYTEKYVETYDQSLKSLAMLARLRAYTGDLAGAAEVLDNHPELYSQSRLSLIKARYLFAIDQKKEALEIYNRVGRGGYSPKDVFNVAALFHQFFSPLDAFIFLLTLPRKTKIKIKNFNHHLMIRSSNLLVFSVYGKVIYEKNDFSGFNMTPNTWRLALDTVNKVNIKQFRNLDKRYVIAYINSFVLDSFYGSASGDFYAQISNMRKILTALSISENSNVYNHMLDCAAYIFGATDRLPEQLESIDDNLGLWQLLALERLFALIGFLGTSYLFRERAREVAIDDYLDDKRGKFLRAKYALVAAIEASNDEKALQVLEKISHSNYTQLQRNKLFCFYNLMTGQVEKAQSYFNELSSEQEKEFYEFFTNKSIAMVAPAATDELNGNTIDAHDLVFRTSTLSHPQSLDKTVYGSRTDIGSFNISDVRSNKLDRFKNEQIDIKIAIFKRETSVEVNKVLPEDNGLIVLRERTFDATKYSLMGTVNHMPDLAMYLILMGGKPSMFSANFFLSNTAYAGGYRRQPSLHVLICIGDNLIVSHAYAKRLYSLGLVKLDKEAKRVVDMTTKSYMQEMESLYRDTIRQTEVNAGN